MDSFTLEENYGYPVKKTKEQIKEEKRTEDCKNALVALAKGYGFDLDISSVKLK